MNNFKSIFREEKPVIAMVHLGALPGTPLYDEDGGLDGIVKNARKDLSALQDAGVDAVMFGNENYRPYEFDVDIASTASMAYVIGCLKHDIKYPLALMSYGIQSRQWHWQPLPGLLLSAKYSQAPMLQIWVFGLLMLAKH